MSDARLWEYGGYWIGHAAGTEVLYAYWYDEAKQRTRRRTLGTKILQQAQDKLIEIAGSNRTESSRSPERVMLLTALDHYYVNDVQAKPSGDQAKRAIALVTDFIQAKMLPTATVASFGPLRQREFMTWCKTEHEHSANYIARVLSVVSAAFRFGKRVVVIRDGFGREQEIQLLDMAPDVVTQAKRVAELMDMPPPTPREWLPTFEEFGMLIDKIGIRQENLFRFIIMSLNTWARPETIIDLRDIPEMVNRRFGVLDLNPPGRRQTRKYRPKIRLTDNLRGWLDEWRDEDPEAEAPMVWDGAPITTMKRTFKRHAEECHLPEFTQGTIRHFMATMVRREKPPVDKEQRDVWLGHDEKRTANAYESFDPDYLAECMHATESVIAKLQACTKRSLSSRKFCASAGFRVIQGGAA